MRIIANALLLAAGLLLVQAGNAAMTTVAVASNFATTAEQLAEQYHQQSGHQVRISSGSSGKLYAQIRHGAPFDVFMSADQDRPERIEEEGLAVPGSRFTYAEGQLVLWSIQPAMKDKDCLTGLQSLKFSHLAIANPETAPYGLAARQWLQKKGLWGAVSKKLVTGENIGQAFHFAASGNAEFGLVAAAQLASDHAPPAACFYRVPATEHAPILQQAVLLQRAKNNPAATGFLEFLQSREAAAAIRSQGYLSPDDRRSASR